MNWYVPACMYASEYRIPAHVHQYGRRSSRYPRLRIITYHTAVGGKKNVASRRRLMESVFVRTGKLVVSLHNLRFARWCKQPLRPKTDALQKFELPDSSNFCNSSKQKYLLLSLPLHIPAELHEYFMEPAKCYHNGLPHMNSP